MTMSDETPLSDVRFLTVAETAAIMRVSLMTVYRRLFILANLRQSELEDHFEFPEAAVLQYSTRQRQ